jgi:hypothetical protein
MPAYLCNKVIDLLIDPDVGGFNNDTLVRSLDDLSAAVTGLFAQIASQAYGIHYLFVHLDSSSFRLHGSTDAQAISITYVHPCNHCTDLKQVVV